MTGSHGVHPALGVTNVLLLPLGVAATASLPSSSDVGGGSSELLLPCREWGPLAGQDRTFRSSKKRSSEGDRSSGLSRKVFRIRTGDSGPYKSPASSQTSGFNESRADNSPPSQPEAVSTQLERAVFGLSSVELRGDCAATRAGPLRRLGRGACVCAGLETPCCSLSCCIPGMCVVVAAGTVVGGERW